VNHGLADYLDPGFNCHKIAGYSLEYDLLRINQVLQLSPPHDLDWLQEYRRDRLTVRLKLILEEINQFFDHKLNLETELKNIDFRRIQQLKIKRLWNKVRHRLNRK
ncbi:MAG: glycosyltransferase family 1 protein, partial [Cyanobacteria bacterium J06553_1]